MRLCEGLSGHAGQDEPYLSSLSCLSVCKHLLQTGPSIGRMLNPHLQEAYRSLGSVTQRVVSIAFRGIYAETPSHLQILNNRIAAHNANQRTILYYGQLIHIAPGHEGEHVTQTLLRGHHVQARKRVS